MNKIYRIIWSDVRHAYTVVSEIAKTQGKKSSESLGQPIRALLAAAVLTCGFFATVPGVQAAAPEVSETKNHQYVALSPGGNWDAVKGWPYVFVTDDNTVVHSSTGGDYKDGTTGGTMAADGTITNGNEVRVGTQNYKFTSYKDGVYTLTSTTDSTKTVNVYRYGYYTLDVPNGNGGTTKVPYRVRADEQGTNQASYGVTVVNQGGYYTSTDKTADNKDAPTSKNVFVVSYQGQGDAPKDVLTKVDHVTSDTGVRTNLQEQLQTVNASTYTSAATGGSTIGGRWDYYIYDDATNSYKNMHQTGSGTLPNRFSQVKNNSKFSWSDTYNAYVYTNNGTETIVPQDNMYVIGGQLGIFTNSDGSLYTGTVYGGGNEILLTTSVDGKIYSFWGAQSVDTAQTMATYPVAKYNTDIETLTNNDKILAHNDIHHLKATADSTGDSVTFNAYRNGTNMNGDETAVNRVPGSTIAVTAGGGTGGIANNGANDRNLTVTEDGTKVTSLNMGSRVGVTNDIAGNPRNTTAGNLQSLTINGTTYGLQTNYAGDDNQTVTKNLGETLNIKGGASTNLATGKANVGVTKTDGNELLISLSQDIDLTDAGSLKTGDTTVDTTGLTIANGPKVLKTGINAGEKQVTYVASGTQNALWTVGNLPATGVAYDANLNNAANIGDIYNLMSSQIDVTSGSNITVNPVNGGIKKYQVNLNDDVTLGEGTSNPVVIQGSGSNASIRLGSNTSNNKVVFNGVTGQGSVAGVTLGQVTATPKVYTSSQTARYTPSRGADEGATTTAFRNTTINRPTVDGTAETGDFVTGLDNTNWDWSKLSIVSGRAATEDQLLKAGQHFFSINPESPNTDMSTIPNYYNEGAMAAASMAVGHGVTTNPTARGSIAIGAAGTSTGRKTTTTTGEGADAKTTTDYSGGQYALAVGNDAQAEGNQSMAIGYNTDAKGDYSLSIGNRNAANGIRSIAIGVDTEAGYESSYANVNSDNYEAGAMQGGADIALGNRSRVNGTGSTAIGFGAKVGRITSTPTLGQVQDFDSSNGDTDLAVAIGGRSLASEDGSVALGNLSYANRASGSRATVTENGVATTVTPYLKPDSVTLKDSMGTLRANYDNGKLTPGSTNNLEEGTAWQANMGAVSIGSEARTGTVTNSKGIVTQTYTMPTITRQLTGLAAGSADTDAVNVAQLKQLAATGTNYQGNNAAVTVHRDAGQTLYIQGGSNYTEDDTTKNFNIYATGNNDDGSIKLQLNDDLKLHTVTLGTADGTNSKEGEVRLVSANGTTETVKAVTGLNSDNKGDLSGNNTQRIQYKDSGDNGKTHTVATLEDDGLKFGGDDAKNDDTKKVVRTLADQELTITGGANTNNLSNAGNVGVVANSTGNGLEIRLNKDITGLNTVTAGTVKMGTQANGSSTETGNYVTGLDNRIWNIGSSTPVDGRAATENQLKNAADQLVSTLGNDSYASSGSALYNGETGAAVTENNGKGTLTINRTKKTVGAFGNTTETADGSFTVDGLHDYYVTGASVGNNNHLTLTRNGLDSLEVDLSGLVTADYQLIANPTEGSNGQYKPNSDGTMSLYVQNGDDTANRKTITLAGLSTNFDADTNADHTNAANTVNLGGTQKIIGGDSDAKKTSGSYTNGNIKTSVNSNGDIVINLNDNPTLKSVILQGTDNSTLTLTKGAGDRLSYSVTNGTTTNNYDVATTKDGYTLASDNNANGVKTELNKKITVGGGAAENTLASDNNIGTTVTQDTDGNATYSLKLNKNLTGLTSVTAGGNSTTAVDMSTNTADGAVIGRQKNLTRTYTDGTQPKVDGTEGDYVTGLDNKDWDMKNPNYISGRAATEDQLKTVTAQVNTNTSNITNNRTDIDNGWNAIVTGGTTTTTESGTTRTDATIKVNPTNQNLTFTEGDNINISAGGTDNRAVIVKTNPNVGFNSVHVAGTGSGSSMTGGIEIGTQSGMKQKGYTYSVRTNNTGDAGYTITTYVPAVDSDGNITGNITKTVATYDGVTTTPTNTTTTTETVATTAPEGKYITGLTNTGWTNGVYVTGRAATEDQLSQVAQQIRGETSAADIYATKGTATDGEKGSVSVDFDMSQSTAPHATISGLHDYYVNSVNVEGTGTNKQVVIKRNDGETYNVKVTDLTDGLATTDYQLVKNQAEGSEGTYTAKDGKLALTVRDTNSNDSSKDQIIDIGGLYTNFGGNNVTAGTATAISKNLGDQLNITGGPLTSAGSTAAVSNNYQYDNIRTESNDNGITIAMKDSPTLKSVEFKNSTDDASPLTVQKSDDGTRLSYTATGGTKQDVANLNDGYTLAADNNTTGVNTKLNKTVTIKGGATTNLTDDTYNGSAVNNIGTAVTQDSNGNTTYTLKLNKDITGLNTVTVGGDTGSTDTVTPAVIGRQSNLTQTVVTTAEDGTTTTTTKNEGATGDYVTGLDNKTWTTGTYVSGRAATEDQLQAVASSISQTVSKGNKYVKNIAMTDNTDGKGGFTGTLTYNDDSKQENAVTGLHDYYVTSAAVADDGKSITLTRNDGTTIPIQLTNVLNNDMRLVGKAVTTGEGTDEKTTYTGVYSVDDVDSEGNLALNVVSADGKQTSQVKINGLAWKETVDKGVNYGSDDGHSVDSTTKKDVWAQDKITNRQLGDTIGIFGGKTSTINNTSYDVENIRTTRDGNGNIVINLSDNPKLQSLILMSDNSTGDTITLKKGNSTTNVDRLTVTPGGNGTAHDVAYTSDNLKFIGNSTLGSTTNTAITKALSDDSALQIVGEGTKADNSYAGQNIKVMSDPTATGGKLVIETAKDFVVNTLQAGTTNTTTSGDGADANTDGVIKIAGAANGNDRQYVDVTAGFNSNDTAPVAPVDAENDKGVISRLKYQTESSDGKTKSQQHTVATLEDGYKLAADNGITQNVALDKTIKISGGKMGTVYTAENTSGTLSGGNNIGVTVTSDNAGGAVYDLRLARDITDLHTVQAGNALLGISAPSLTTNGTLSTNRDSSGSYLTNLDNKNWYINNANGSITTGSVRNGETISYVSGRAATEDQLKSAVEQLSTTINNHENSTYGLTADTTASADGNKTVTKKLGENINLQGAVSKDANGVDAVLQDGADHYIAEDGTKLDKDTDDTNKTKAKKVKNITTSKKDDDTVEISLADRIALNTALKDSGSAISMWGKTLSYNTGSDKPNTSNNLIQIDPDEGISILHTNNDGTVKRDGLRITGPTDYYRNNGDGTYTAVHQYDSNGSVGITNATGAFTARMADMGGTGYLGLGNTMSTVDDSQKLNLTQMTTVTAATQAQVDVLSTSSQYTSDDRDAYGQVAVVKDSEGRALYVTPSGTLTTDYTKAATREGKSYYQDKNGQWTSDTATVPILAGSTDVVNWVDENNKPVYKVDGRGNVLYQTNDDGTFKVDSEGKKIPVSQTVAGALVSARYGTASLNETANAPGKLVDPYRKSGDRTTMTRLQYLDENHFDPTTGTFDVGVVHEVATLDDGLKVHATYDVSSQANTDGSRNALLNQTLNFTGTFGSGVVQQIEAKSRATNTPVTLARSSNITVATYDDPNGQQNTNVLFALQKDIKGFNTIQVGGTDEASNAVAGSSNATGTIRIGNIADTTKADMPVTLSNASNLRSVSSNGQLQNVLYEAKDDSGNVYYTTDTSDSNVEKLYRKQGGGFTKNESESDGTGYYVGDDGQNRYVSFNGDYSDQKLANDPNGTIAATKVYQVTKDGKTYYTTQQVEGAKEVQTTLNRAQGRYIAGLSNTNWDGNEDHISDNRAATEAQLKKAQQQVSQYKDYNTTQGIGGGFGITAGDGKSVTSNLGQTITVRGDGDVTSTTDTWTGNIKTKAEDTNNDGTPDVITAFMNKDIRLGTNNNGTVADDGSLYVGGIKLGVLSTTTNAETGQVTTVHGADYGGYQGTNLASGTTGQKWTSTNRPSYLPNQNLSDADLENLHLNNAANIGDIYNIANQAINNVASNHTVVTVGGKSAGEPVIPEGQTKATGEAVKGGNLVLQKTIDNGKATYDVKLDNQVTLGEGPKDDGQGGTTAGEAGTLNLTDNTGKTTVAVDGQTGSITNTSDTSKTVTNAGGVTISNVKTETNAETGEKTTTTTEAVKLDNSGLAVKSDDGTKDVVKVDKNGLTVNDASGNEAVKVDNKGLTVKASDVDKAKGLSDISVKQGDVSMGGNQTKNLASGEGGKLWGTGENQQAYDDNWTQDQKNNANNAANMGDVYKYMKDAKDDANSKHTAVTVNGGTKAPGDEKAGDTSYTTGNLQLNVSTKDGKNTYDLKLSDNLELGKKGADGKDGSIGVNGKDGESVTINGKDGISIKGQDGKDGSIGLSGKDGISVKGKDGKDGVTIKGLDGENGTDGQIGVKGADGSGVVINGKDGSIGLNGKDGANGLTMKGDKGSVGVDGTDGKDGKDGMTRITYTDSNNTKHEVATLDDGMKYGGDFGDEAAVKLDHKVNIKGGAKNEADLTDGNIGIVSSKADKDGNATLNVKLNKDLDLTDKGSVKTGNTTMNTNGITVTKSTDLSGNKLDSTTTYGGDGMTISTKITTTGGQSGNQTIQISPTNVTMGGNQVHDVGSGYDGHLYQGRTPEETQMLNNAASIGDLNATTSTVVNQFNGAVNRLGNRINRVGAGAAALAALHPTDFDPDDKWDFAAGYGHYKDANAAAIGVYYRPNEDTMFSIGGSMGGGENMLNAGVSFKLGQGNHITNSRVAMARTIQSMQVKMDAMAKEIETLKSGGAPISGGAAVSKDVSFPDVPANHWAYEYVQSLAKRGLIEGYPDGEFKGDRQMTRYEFAAIIYRALQNGAPVDGGMARSVDEFEPEIADVQKAYRFRVDRVAGKDNDRNKIERVRVNDKDDPATGDYRDVYGGKIQKPAPKA